ncbi:flagellar biosynthesis protein FlhF [bacterium]|nr:flagellar biosynthesis protein FlhF [bacterium]
MDVQKFEAFSMQDAIKLVKRELGRDAVILSTREKTAAPDGSGKPVRLIEVTAAPAASNANRNQQASAGKVKTSVLSPEEAGRAQRINFPKVEQKNDVNVVRSVPTLGQLNPSTRTLAKTLATALEPTSSSGTAASTSQVARRATHLTSAELTASSTAAQGKNQQTNDSALVHLNSVSRKFDEHAGDEVKLLREEITRVRREIEQIPHVNVSDQMQEIRVLLHDLMRHRYQNESDSLLVHDESLNDICIKLRAAGVLEAIISELTHVVTSGPKPTHSDGSPLTGEKLKEHYLNQSIRFLFRQMSVTPQANFANQKVIALVGSTGVGKTTSIAKLAARLQLTDKKRVAMVSMDSFRIAAADQLRAYSKILDCPFTEVSDLQDLAEFVTKFYDYDLIFIDTAGRSSKHHQQLDQLKQLGTMPFPVHFHMVQSASMKQRDLDENLKAFRMISPQSLIFTKLDESWSFGEILNTNITSRIPLSFFTTGQKVPEDLEPATKERVVERIFRL